MRGNRIGNSRTQRDSGFPASPPSRSDVICLLDNDPALLAARTELLSAAGWQVEAFSHPEPFLEYVRAHRPSVAAVDFGGSHATGLKVANRLRDVCPTTRVIMLLKIHRGKGQPMRPGDELINLINQQCGEAPEQFPFRSSPLEESRDVA